MRHKPVLLGEICEGFRASELKVFIDGTLGAGGHAEALLAEHPEMELYLGVDQDPEALAIAKERLASFGKKVRFAHGNFDRMEEFLKREGKKKADGILLDIGVSSMQLDQPEKGFSFLRDGPLDMRMDPSRDRTAADIVNQWSERELGELFRELGEEPRWRRAAKAIVEARRKEPLSSTGELARILKAELGSAGKKHPATLVFQALRIAVNDELSALQRALTAALSLLNVGGRLAVISFHSLEDRIVKTCFQEIGRGNKRQGIIPHFQIVTKKPLVPSFKETRANPRSRSAKLRIVEKL